jgi:hypothetical protein
MSEVKYYGMFSDEGNQKVQEIVQRGLDLNLPWLEVYQDLVKLAESDRDRFGEATDTMVRDIVYEALGRYNENFYV